MFSFDDLWYAMEHPLGPSRELGLFANHQESVEQLIREMNARVLPEDDCLSRRPREGGKVIRAT
ncbi:MAG: hypothetical protein NVSMB60_28620 [Mycobacterium sp.]